MSLIWDFYLNCLIVVLWNMFLMELENWEERHILQVCLAGSRTLLYPPDSYPYNPSPLSCLTLTQPTFETLHSHNNKTQRKRPRRKDLLASDTPRDEGREKFCGPIVGLCHAQCCILQETTAPSGSSISKNLVRAEQHQDSFNHQ